MSLYVGYYYGTFLNSYDFLTAEEIEGFYNGESFEIIQDLENKKISMVSTENEPFFIIGKQVNSDSFYDVFYSGLVQDFDINKFLNLNKEESEKELIEKLK